jgi:hypothetical protein
MIEELRAAALELRGREKTEAYWVQRRAVRDELRDEGQALAEAPSTGDESSGAVLTDRGCQGWLEGQLSPESPRRPPNPGATLT